MDKPKFDEILQKYRNWQKHTLIDKFCDLQLQNFDEFSEQQAKYRKVKQDLFNLNFEIQKIQ